MSQVMLEEAAAQFTELINQARSGEEVVIVDNSIPIAKIVPIVTEASKPRTGGFGSAKDKLIYMADDFDAPLEDFKDYM